MMEVVPGKQRSTLQKLIIFHDNSLLMIKNYLGAITKTQLKIKFSLKGKKLKNKKDKN
jgi:hypothetical protein